jgi:hypothetical protein
MRLKNHICRIDGEIKKEIIPLLSEKIAIISPNKRAKILGPENNAVYVVRSGGYAGYPAVVRILYLKHPAVHLFHEPFHVKCGNIGSAGCRNDHGGIKIGLGVRYVILDQCVPAH